MRAYLKLDHRRAARAQVEALTGPIRLQAMIDQTAALAALAEVPAHERARVTEATRMFTVGAHRVAVHVVF